MKIVYRMDLACLRGEAIVLLRYRCFPVNFPKFIKTAIFLEYLRKAASVSVPHENY